MPSAEDLALAIAVAYEDLLGTQHAAEALDQEGPTSDRLKFLKRVREGGLLPAAFDDFDTVQWMEALIDTLTASEVSGSSRRLHEMPGLSDASMLGRASDRRGILLSSGHAPSEWWFQVHVQAWAGAEIGKPVSEMSNDPRYSNMQERTCDFALEIAVGKTQLIECKRVHPHPLYQRESLDLEAIAVKVYDKLVDDALPQLARAAQLVGGECLLHVIADVTEYGPSWQCKEEDSLISPVILGISAFQIGEIVDQIKSLCGEQLAALDVLTICWRNILKFADTPIALLERSIEICEKRVGNYLSYDGWTVECYPSPTEAIREIRVSRAARDISWIKATWYALQDRLVSYGPEESAAGQA